jgi:branched-chain amino acid transport system substrate-binding protein
MSRALRLGVATSLSGPYAPFGGQVAEGFRCYVRDVNRGAGIQVDSHEARPIELFVEDDRSDAEVLQERLRKLIRLDRIDLVFGPYGSGLTLAAAGVASSFGAVLWNHGGASDEIHERYPKACIGVLSPASTYLAAVLDMIEGVAPPVLRVALVHGETGFGAEVARGVLEWVARRGCAVWRRACRPGDAGAIEAAAVDLCAEESDVVLGAGRFEDDVALADALWRRRPKTRAVALVAAGIDRFREALGGRSDGFLAPSQWDSSARIAVDFGPTAEAVAASYGSGTNLPLDYPAAQAYAAALVAQWCVERSRSLDSERIREAASRARLTTFYGRFGIDPENGRQIGHEILVTRWRRGRREILWPTYMADTGERILGVPWEPPWAATT